jgi:hypothetical protein
MGQFTCMRGFSLKFDSDRHGLTATEAQGGYAAFQTTAP